MAEEVGLNVRDVLKNSLWVTQRIKDFLINSNSLNLKSLHRFPQGTSSLIHSSSLNLKSSKIALIQSSLIKNARLDYSKSRILVKRIPVGVEVEPVIVGVEPCNL